MTSEVRVFQRKSSVDQSQTWTVTFRNGARESMPVGSNGMTGGLWTIDAVENDDDPNDVTRWVEVFHHSPQQPAPPAEKYVPTWGPEWEYVDRAGSIRQFEYRDVVGVQPIVLSCELLGISRYCEDGRYLVGDNPSHFDIVSQRPRTPAPVETSDAPSQPEDVPQESAELTTLRERLAGAEAEIKRARHGCITYDAGPYKSVLEMEIAMLRKRVDEAEPKAETADAIRAELAAVTAERDELKASFDLEDDGTPEYGTPAYELFDKAITWTVHQLKNVLGVKEWSTSGGGTETLDGDLRMELNDLLKAAGRDDDSMETLRAELARAKEDGERMRKLAARLADRLRQAQAQWKMYADERMEYDDKGNEIYFSEADHAEADLWRNGERALKESLAALAPRAAGAEENHFADAGKMVVELRRQSLEAHMRGDLNTADRIATLIGDELPSKFEKEDLQPQHEEGGE